MNRLLQKGLLILFPFFPLLAWLVHFAGNKPLRFYLSIVFLPIAFSFLTNSKKKLPNYLLFLIAFSLYHVASSFINNTIPTTNNKIYWLLTDFQIFACALLIIIENVDFDEKFIVVMNRNILLIVVLSLIVSLIQVKDPTFFFNTMIDMTLYVGEGDIRITSIYSWVDPNSGGITFPILIAILLNFYTSKSKFFPLIILCGIVVSFLSKARFVMISALIAFSQIFLNRKLSFQKLFSLIFIFAISIYLIVFAAGEFGFNIQEVISNRILEKDTEMGSAKARITSYEVFIKKFPENPLFGVGPETKQDVLDLLGDIPAIHVGYLSYLYFYGIVGCFFLFLALYYLFADAWLVGKKFGFWGGFYGLVSFAVANLTFVYFNFSEMGIVLIAIYTRFYKSRYLSVNSSEVSLVQTAKK
jgi:O-Antigen ligase